MGGTTQTQTQQTQLLPRGALEQRLRDLVLPSISRIGRQAGEVERLGGRVGQLFEGLAAEIGDIPGVATIRDFFMGGVTPEQKAQVSGVRRRIRAERLGGLRSTFQDLMGGAEGAARTLEARTGTTGTAGGAVRGAGAAGLARTLGSLEAELPSSFDISRGIGKGLAGIRGRNYALMGQFADIGGRLRATGAGLRGLGADIGARQIGLGLQEQIAGGKTTTETEVETPLDPMQFLSLGGDALSLILGGQAVMGKGIFAK